MEISEILTRFETVAVVGISKNVEKHAHEVPKYLKEHGYSIIPINPTADEILGEKAYPNLLTIPDELARKVEIVDVFRPPEEVGKIVEDAIVLRKKFGTPHVIWMQLGIINEEATENARRAGFEVVMDHCMMKEHKKLMGVEESESE
jgi:predicted CoA-binding protein